MSNEHVLTVILPRMSDTLHIKLRLANKTPQNKQAKDLSVFEFHV
jgi:hypothetical protein